LRNQAGANTWTGNITLGANSLLNVVGASSLSVTGTILTNTLTKIGTGDLTIGGGVANTSSLTVSQGKVLLNKTGADIDSANNLTIGDDFGGDNADVVQIASTVVGRQRINGALTVNSSGLLDLNGMN